MRSIKYRIFIFSFLLSSFIFILLSLFISIQAEKFIFDSLEDNLHSKMQLLIGLIHEEKNKLEFELSEIKGGEYSILGSGHYYIVNINNTEIVSPSISDNKFIFIPLNKIEKNKSKNEKLYTSLGTLGENVIVLEKDFFLYDKKVKIFVAESTKESTKILNNIKNSIYLFNIIAIIFLCLINYLIVNKFLKPLDLFSREISSIS
ncbi:MAG: hypothetical protein ACK4IX_04945, partial [Candidatus Sericytochromatia bacterium]